MLHTVQTNLDTGSLYRVIDIYDDKQKRLAICRRALILQPDGAITLVSIEQVIASELSMLDKVDVEDVNSFAQVIDNVKKTVVR